MHYLNGTQCEYRGILINTDLICFSIINFFFLRFLVRSCIKCAVFFFLFWFDRSLEKVYITRRDGTQWKFERLFCLVDSWPVGRLMSEIDPIQHIFHVSSTESIDTFLGRIFYRLSRLETRSRVYTFKRKTEKECVWF